MDKRTVEEKTGDPKTGDWPTTKTEINSETGLVAPNTPYIQFTIEMSEKAHLQDGTNASVTIEWLKGGKEWRHLTTIRIPRNSREPTTANGQVTMSCWPVLRGQPMRANWTLKGEAIKAALVIEGVDQMPGRA